MAKSMKMLKAHPKSDKEQDRLRRLFDAIKPIPTTTTTVPQRDNQKEGMTQG